MKIEDAIKRYESWAEDDRIDILIRKEHKQMADWLKELKTDRPQGEWIIEIDVNGNTYGRCSVCGMKQYAGQLNFCPDCGAKMKRVDDENETQNSNLTFEKVMEKIQTQVIEFPDTHQKFIFERKIEMDGDSIKICDWEYKGIKDE